MYIDSHAHLTSPELFPQIEQILQSAQEKNVLKIVNICTENAELIKGLELEKRYSCVHNAAAVHPHDVEKEGLPFFLIVQEAAKEKKLVAIGETGLDYHYMHAPREVQQDFFLKHLRLAKAHKLTVIIHCREAFEDLFILLDSELQQREPFILHCFTGTAEEADEVLKRGGTISFSGIVTFKKSEELRNVIKKVPLDKLLIETDAPYLAPQSQRGKINQPAFVVEIAEMVAAVKGLSLAELAKKSPQKMPAAFLDFNMPAPFLPKDPHNCPYLILAPMEGVGDRCFRKAMASVGGFDEAVTDFLRVPSNAHVKSLACAYQADETFPIPLAAQIMGSDPELMAAMAQELEKRGAPRIDLNCGCPSSRVTGRGAGSSLLKDPNFLHENARAIVKAVSIPVTVKMRSGYEDTTLFKENLLAAEESGISYLTLHPRTKVDGYGPPANWDLIAQAKSILKIPLVGNGDILNVSDALRMLSHTACDALMIGRGSIINPFIFHQIRSHFEGKTYQPTSKDLSKYLDSYLKNIPTDMPEATKINKMKQLLSFVFKNNSELLLKRQAMLTTTYKDLPSFLKFSLNLLF